MKKYKLILPIALSLFIIGCNNNQAKSQTNTEETQSVSTDNAKKDTSTSTPSADNTSKDTSNSTKSAQETSSSDKNANSESKILIDEKTLAKNLTFSFGMSLDNVTLKIKDFNLENQGTIEITSSQNDPEFGNKVLLTNCMTFSFDKNNQLYAIGVTDKIPTSLGLQIGDSLEKTEQLYGKNYNKYEIDNNVIYEYTIDDHYFRVFIDANKVTRWVVTTYKFVKY